MHLDVGCFGALGAVGQQWDTHGMDASGDLLSPPTWAGDVVGSLLDQYGPRGDKSRCYDVAVLMEMVVQSQAASALPSSWLSQLFFGSCMAMPVSGPSLQLSSTTSMHGCGLAEKCSDACVCERCLATPYGTVRLT